MAAAAKKPALLRLLCIIGVVSRRRCIAFAPSSARYEIACSTKTRTSTHLSQEGQQEDGPPKYSDLKSLLPTPMKRTLRLDKHGRRIHDMDTDHSPSYIKAHDNAANPSSSQYEYGPAEPSTAMQSDHDATLAQQSDDGPLGEGDSPSLSQISGVHSSKELAADASSGDFEAEVKVSADLKALLPQQKMRFMKVA